MIPKKVIPVKTAKAAPAFTPRMPGSPRGLRVTPCMACPGESEGCPYGQAPEGAHDARIDNVCFYAFVPVPGEFVEEYVQRYRAGTD